MSMPSLKAAAERVGGNGEMYLDADGCAVRYVFSRRHWLRLVDSGRAPQPTRFGRLVRWSLESLSEWEAGGCKPIRTVTSALQSPKRQKKNAKKSAELEQDRLIARIRNLFELEGWSTERIAEAVELPLSEVIRIIQTSPPKKTEAL